MAEYDPDEVADIFINDVPYYSGKQRIYRYGTVDNPLNILANKLTSIVGRDEPKDMFDIIHICIEIVGFYNRTLDIK